MIEIRSRRLTATCNGLFAFCSLEDTTIIIPTLIIAPDDATRWISGWMADDMANSQERNAENGGEMHIDVEKGIL